MTDEIIKALYKVLMPLGGGKCLYRVKITACMLIDTLGTSMSKESSVACIYVSSAAVAYSNLPH